MKIAITGGKGGTGKSIVATSLAVEFARTKKTILRFYRKRIVSTIKTGFA